MESRHAIIVIKNENNDYLQYYDERWKSYLFFNCKVNDENDSSKIKDELKEKLSVFDFKINYRFDKVHTKFSVSNGIDKTYHHYFYEVILNDFKYFNEAEFMINNIKYKWFSYDELLTDKRIQEVNSDIVGFIKDI